MSCRDIRLRLRAARFRKSKVHRLRHWLTSNDHHYVPICESETVSKLIDWLKTIWHESCDVIVNRPENSNSF